VIVTTHETQDTAPPADTSIFTVPMGVPFLDCIADAVLTGNLPRIGNEAIDLLALPETTILLPTRRAARALQEAFLRRARGKALLLPKIKPISEGDEDRSLISGLASSEAFTGALEIPPAIGELERRLVMTHLVQHWSHTMRAKPDDCGLPATVGARTPAQAAQLAAELCQLLDVIETEGVALDALTHLVPDDFASHWQQTLQFLHIVISMWPAHLEEIRKLSPADRRNRLIRAEAERLIRDRPDTPMIVAGVTGSIPATTELMQAVASLPNGAIVLPGLDRDLDAESWSAVAASHPEHPQHGLAKLLAALGAAREDISVLSGLAPATHYAGRAWILSESMRPAPTTDRWHRLSDELTEDMARQSLQDITCLTAPTSQDEAETIALILREAAETPGRTAALISPDRLLARRVAVRLESWGIRVDDSAGRPFAKTVPGSFLDMVVEVAAQEFAPKPLMSLLKHPLSRLGMTALDIRRAARALEIIAFRAPYLGYGMDGLEMFVEQAAMDVAAKARRGKAVTRLWDEDWQSARDLMARLRTAYAPLLELERGQAAHDLRTLVTAHISVAEALAATGDDAADGAELWRDEAGQTAALLFASFNDDTLTVPDVTLTDYPDFYRALIGTEAVRPTIPTHPRIFIWGPFEARLQRPDVVVLGALNEGTWPAPADPGPWLNRPMRAKLGLPQPEERIGHAAHDLVQLFGAERVYLTRAEKVDGNPTVPSRWLLRLQAVLGALGTADVLEPRRPWLAWARHRDAIPASKPTPALAPAPCPPLALRPRRLSVSDVETWISNPYGLFAKRILDLDQLPPLGQEPDASLRGSIIHDALGQFATEFPTQLPPDISRELADIAGEIFDRYTSHPRIRSFWLQRFQRFADWFAAEEPGLRKDVTIVLAERNGAHVFDAPNGPFTLTARADRIDLTPGGITITDYKTGASLDTLKRDAGTGKAPQLLLEAVIALSGGFPGIGNEPPAIRTLRYISASGGEPPGRTVDVAIDDVAAKAAEIARELEALIARFDNPATPYRAIRRPKFDYRYDAYAHLARVAEWSAIDDGQDTNGSST
jgi:ATP-dependent helicase/nuclease subunit B